MTDEFVSFRTTACENVPLPEIASLKRQPPLEASDSKLAVFLTVVLWALLTAPITVPTLPVSRAWALWETIRSSDPVFGTWESLNESERVVLGYSSVVTRERFARKEGRYDVQNGQLRITYDSGEETVVRIRFECELLIAGSREMRLDSMPLKKAYAPIVGTWPDGNRVDRSIWEFRPDGTCRVDDTAEEASGDFRRHGDEWQIVWRASGLPETGRLRLTAKHLFITANGNTTECRRP